MHAWLIETCIQKHASTHCHRDLSLGAGTGKGTCSMIEERLRYTWIRIEIWGSDANHDGQHHNPVNSQTLGLRQQTVGGSTNHPAPNHIMRQHCDCYGEDGLRWARFVIGLILPQPSPWGSFHFVSPFLSIHQCPAGVLRLNIYLSPSLSFLLLIVIGSSVKNRSS